MTAKHTAEFLTTAANAITVFAVVQNLTLSYSLAKREVRLKVRTRLGMWIVILWNALLYALPVWWCGHQAALILPAPTARSAQLNATAALISLARLSAIAVFGTLSAWLLAIYGDESHWRSD